MSTNLVVSKIVVMQLRRLSFKGINGLMNVAHNIFFWRVLSIMTPCYASHNTRFKPQNATSSFHKDFLFAVDASRDISK